ncbi:MAG TPA: glycoside hydrolase family 3 N-terminal domain-containing protein [Candidatus Limnocylindrales bacterium]|nr:glycoside hydrolase family 3 N-terminal domain-containing protein [Candidatus Limnocylindrales bacterium]
MTTIALPYRDPALPYRDAALPIGTRAADLLARMTRAEKVAQLGSFWAFEVVRDDALDVERLAALAPDGIGHITRLAGSTNLRPHQVAATANAIQRQLVEGTRLGIPAIIHEECLHGLIAWAAPTFQQSIGAAAAFDPDLVTAVATTIRRRMLLTGARHALAPVFDIARDPRWGRIEETYGEDPYLATVLGCAYVEALQGPDLADGVLATAKHMVGHGLAEGGRNQAPAHLGPRELRDEQLVPFEAAVRHARIGSVMPAYCDVDGVPCHASTELLGSILRGEWGFDGIVASDYMGVEMISTAHRLTPDLGEAARLALAAGVDAELPRTVAWGRPLLDALADGRVDEVLLDAAVERVLRMKLRLGLFDRPYVDPPTDGAFEELAVAEAEAARSLAERSIVLLENRGVLPLDPGLRRIAVVGPIADSARDLLGDYSHLVHMETLQEMRSGVDALGVIGDGEVFAPGDELTGRRTILDALRSAVTGAQVVHARGTGISDGSDEELAAAVAAARDADVAVVVLGERSGLTDDSTTGEFRDRVGLGFMGRQQELLEAVVATGTPVVLVVVSGRPLAIPWAAEHCAAVLLAWVPGDAGPDAIAGVLTGAVNPSGKLPVSMPRSVGQLPLSYRHHPTGGRSHPKGDYVDSPVSPLWPFGFGRSYTTFAFEDLRLDRSTVETTGDEVAIRVDVTNTGPVAGDEVVQLYVRDEEATIARPVRELRGFRRVHLEPGERRTVSFGLSTEQLCYVGADLRRVVEPGRVSVQVGASSTDLPLAAELTLRGPVVELVERRRYLTTTTVE